MHCVLGLFPWLVCHSCYFFLHVGFCIVLKCHENVADEKASGPFTINMRQKKALNGSHLEVLLAPQCSTEHDFDLSISYLFLTFV